MKYGKVLVEELRAVPARIRVFCVSYKWWKRWTPGCSNWKLSLLNDAFWASFCPSELWNTNMKTLYKVCKRLNKRFGLPTMEFYTWLTKSDLFTFTTDAKKVYLNVLRVKDEDEQNGDQGSIRVAAGGRVQ